jgi:hypothetical protein
MAKKKKRNEDLVERVAAELRSAANALESRFGKAKRKTAGKKGAAKRKAKANA